MCVSIYTDNGTEIEYIRQLRELVGDDAITFWKDIADDPQRLIAPEVLAIYQDKARLSEADGWCLCQVDIDATMAKAGYRVTWPDHRMHCDVRKLPQKLPALDIAVISQGNTIPST